MSKQAPSLGRILAMVVFALSCFGLLLFLWLAFGGSVPLKAKGYRFEAAFAEAPTLAQEADVRMAGVNVGKVKAKRLDKGAARTLVTIEMQGRYAPIPSDSRAMLRQKTLLGETYVELAPGGRGARKLEDGERLPDTQIEPTVELDEIFDAFDRPTREAFQEWVAELAKASRGKGGEALNDAFGNLSGFAVDGAKLVRVLDEQEQAVRGLVRNTGEVFGAINERDGALRELIVNSNDTFEATASRQEALAQTFEVFPTFLDESKATLARLEHFARNTRPLVNDLKRPADDLAPTLRDLARLAPDLERLFGDLPPLVRASRTGAPPLERVVRGLGPVAEAGHTFLSELNPILSYFNFHQATVAGFLSNGGPDLSGKWMGEQRVQTQVGIIDARSFETHPTARPFFERGNAYMAPNALQRGIALGTIESLDCAPAGGEQRDPDDAIGRSDAAKSPPCFVQPPSLFDGKRFSMLQRGVAPNVPAPTPGRGGTQPADPNR